MNIIIIFSTIIIVCAFSFLLFENHKEVGVFAQVDENISNTVGNEDQRPNILFILSDNQAARLLGTYGNTNIQTPNIDKLAEKE